MFFRGLIFVLWGRTWNIVLFFPNVYLFWTWLFLTTFNVKLFGVSNVEACHSINIHTRVLIFGMNVLYGSTIGVVELTWKCCLIFFQTVTCFEFNCFLSLSTLKLLVQVLNVEACNSFNIYTRMITFDWHAGVIWV